MSPRTILVPLALLVGCAQDLVSANDTAGVERQLAPLGPRTPTTRPPGSRPSGGTTTPPQDPPGGTTTPPQDPPGGGTTTPAEDPPTGGTGDPTDPPTDPPADPPADPVRSAQVRTRLAQAGIRAMPPAPAVSEAMFLLGQALMFDRELSGNRDIACATCHHPSESTTDGRTLPAGAGAIGLGPARTPDPVIARNAPPLFNLDLAPSMFWDSRVEIGGPPPPPGQRPRGPLVTPAGDLLTPAMAAVLTTGVVGAQAMFPVTSHDEMVGQPGENDLADLDGVDEIWSGLMARLGDIPAYRSMFEAAYPGTSFDTMTFAHAGNAIGSFEIAAYESRGSRFEQFLEGDDVLTPAELDGADAFLNAGCQRCHGGPALSDFRPHNTALPQIGPGHGDGPTGLDDYGREDVAPAGAPPSRYAFRTPPLTNVTLTGPWGHAGQFDRLDAFVAHYANPAGALRNYDPRQNVADPTLWSTHFTGSDQDILARIDPATNATGPVQVGPIVTFLGSLEDPDALDLDWTIPARVPSGLPVR